VRRLVLLLAGAATLAGCELDFTEPPSPIPVARAANLTGIVRYESAATDSLRILGSLYAGTDADGTPVEPFEDVLRLLDLDVLPGDTLTDGRRRYRERLPVPAGADLAAVRLQAPRVRGPMEPAPELVFPLIRRTGTGTVDVGADDFVVLRSDAGSTAGRASTSRAWALVIEDVGGSSILTLSAGGLPPPAIEVPVSLLEDRESAELVARLMAQERWQTETASGDYRLYVESVSELRWTLRWPE
jgi:hypothetical protein